jgi:hypothetical protein
VDAAAVRSHLHERGQKRRQGGESYHSDEGSILRFEKTGIFGKLLPCLGK